MKIRILRSPCIQSDQLVVGIDLAKNDCVAVAQTDDGGITKPLKFETNWNGFATLLEFAQRTVQTSRVKGFVVALEPTGHSGVPWVQ